MLYIINYYPDVEVCFDNSKFYKFTSCVLFYNIEPFGSPDESFEEKTWYYFMKYESKNEWTKL